MLSVLGESDDVCRGAQRCAVQAQVRGICAWTLWLLRVRLPVCLNTWTAQGCSCQELTWSHALARLQLVGPACGLDVSALVVVFGRMTDGK